MKNPEIINPRDSKNPSPWQKVSAEDSEGQVNPVKSGGRFDVLIVGAGITGLTTGLMLQNAGKKCLIVETGKIGFGTTGGTTAHLNTFFDATYPQVENDFGEVGASLLADSGKQAMKIIAEFAEQYQIDCELEYKDGYLFSESGKETKQLERILESSRKAGVQVQESESNDVPVPFEKAIRFARQGQFHPMKYIRGLAAAFKELGGLILENSFVSDRKEQEGHVEILVGGQTFQAKYLVYATHIPPGITSFSLRCAPYRSYVLGVKLQNNHYPTGLAYDMQEPYHYFRTHVIDGERYLLIGGEDHKTGQDDSEQAYINLEAYARKYYQVASVDYKWSSQYYIPVDGLTYIGPLVGNGGNIFIATGFNGNGMMFGTISGKIISDQILGLKNKYGDLFAPSRLKPISGFSEFVKENANVVWRFIADRFGKEELDKLSALKRGEGKVAEFQGEKVAIFKDQQGKVTALSPVCTHAGCYVNFNAAEQSWDCPCHGGRFNTMGKVVCGPPQNDLEEIKLPG